MMAEQLINVGGQTVNANNVTVPNSRAFRDAWQLSGDVIEVDMAKARDIKIEKLVTEALTLAEEAEKEQRILAAKGNNSGAAAAAARANRFRGVPAQAAQNAINNAANPAALEAVTIDQFLP